MPISGSVDISTAGPMSVVRVHQAILQARTRDKQTTEKQVLLDRCGLDKYGRKRRALKEPMPVTPADVIWGTHITTLIVTNAAIRLSPRVRQSLL